MTRLKPVQVQIVSSTVMAARMRNIIAVGRKPDSETLSTGTITCTITGNPPQGRRIRGTSRTKL